MGRSGSRGVNVGASKGQSSSLITLAKSRCISNSRQSIEKKS